MREMNITGSLVDTGDSYWQCYYEKNTENAIRGWNDLCKSKHWRFYEELFPEGASILVYGYGDVGKDFVYQILHSKRLTLYGGVDRRYGKQKKGEVSFYEMGEIAGLRCDYVLIAILKESIAEEVKKELLEVGVPEEKIVWEDWIQSGQYEEKLKSWYYSTTGQELNLMHPVTYNEKIQWIKLYGITPLIARLTDKYAVRDWVKDQIGERYLTPLLGMWKSFDDIDISSLPEQFVLKCNHGCGWNEVVKEKKNWNVENAKKNFDSWMHLNYAFICGLELQYKDIVPCIIAEEYLENENGSLYDYKFWCFHGKVEFIMFLSERSKGLKMNNYDREWNLLPFTYNYPNSEKAISRPEKLNEMIAIAERLAKGFPHVRVDLYQLNDGTIKFGEMTFTPYSGCCCWSDEDTNARLGRLIHL